MSNVGSILDSPSPMPPGSERRVLEYQAIILAGSDPALLYPLLQDRQCLALLPVANKPLLYYQLRTLEKAGFAECIVAVEESFRKPINDYLAKSQFKIKVELFFPKLVDEQWDTGTVLKQMSSMIITDFIVISGDLVSEASIHDIVDVHRTRDATATIVLKENEPIDWKELHSTAATFSYTAVQAQEYVKTFYGLQASGQHMSDHRVVMVRTSEGDVGPTLLGRNVLEQCPRFVLHTNLTDSHLYVFKRWVLYLIEDQNLLSIKDDVLPYLVAIQFRKDFAQKHPEVWAKAKSSQNLSYSMSAAATVAPGDEDRIRVYSFVAPYKKSGSMFIARASSLESYGWMSFAILDQPVSEMTPWEPFQSAAPLAPSEDGQSEIASMKSGADRGIKLVKTLLGEKCSVHPTASLTRCIVGDNCVIGANVKMRNCLILAGTRIEDGVQMENCLVAVGANIQKKSTLNKCQVGPRYVVSQGTSAENAMLNNIDDDDSDDQMY